jgi:hypothetical protein
MNGRGAEQARQLAREKALYHYSSALERGDFGIVSAILGKAGRDPALERMLLGMNEVYRAEMEGQPVHTTQRWLFARLLRRTRNQRKGERKMKQERSSRAKRQISGGSIWGNRLVAGGVLLGIALTFAIGLSIYTGWGRFGGTPAFLPPPTEAPAAVELQFASSASKRWAVGDTDEAGNRGFISEQPAIASTPVPAPPSREASMWGLAQPVERLIIRNGSISMIVEDTRAAQQSVEELVTEMAGEGAYVVSSEEYGGVEGGSPHIGMTIRVPAAHFDQAMDRLAGLAVEVVARNESGQDVTEEYVDIETRLESLEAARERLLEIMQETRTTKDLLEAERQLTEREAEIESLKGRMQYLAQSAQLAGIRIELQPYILSQPVSAHWRPAEAVRQAVETLMDSLRSFGGFLIFFVIAVLPWAVVLGLAVYGIVRFVLWRVRVGHKKRAAGDQRPGPAA